VNHNFDTCDVATIITFFYTKLSISYKRTNSTYFFNI